MMSCALTQDITWQIKTVVQTQVKITCGVQLN